jgi:UDP-N-acetylmuramoyl-tripeptide--D-alanyl-D-alanine ligase
VDEKAVVLECGMDSKGEIAWHANSVDPDIGVLLNIGHVHAEKLGSIEDVFNEKKDLADYMLRTGKPLVLNIDDERLATIKSNDSGNSPIITFGKSKDADFQISDILVDSEGTKFTFHYYDNDIEVKLKVFGEGYAYNAMAAIIVANVLQVSINDCVSSVREYVGTKGRFEVLRYANDLVIINDAYNANPTSMEMSIKTFSAMFKTSDYHRIVVLGDMKELGDVAEEKHRLIGKLVQEEQFDEVYFVGDMYNYFNVGDQIASADEIAALLNDKLSNRGSKKVAILLKGSHSLGLYQIPDFLHKLGAL